LLAAGQYLFYLEEDRSVFGIEEQRLILPRIGTKIAATLIWFFAEHGILVAVAGSVASKKTALAKMSSIQ
jgi:hypothetical protein